MRTLPPKLSRGGHAGTCSERSGGGATLSAEPLLAPGRLRAQGKRGGILRVRGYDPPHFDPHLALNFKQSNTLSFVYNKLGATRWGRRPSRRATRLSPTWPSAGKSRTT